MDVNVSGKNSKMFQEGVLTMSHRVQVRNVSEWSMKNTTYNPSLNYNTTYNPSLNYNTIRNRIGFTIPIILILPIILPTVSIIVPNGPSLNSFKSAELTWTNGNPSFRNVSLL